MMPSLLRKTIHYVQRKMLSTERIASLIGLRDPSWTQRDYHRLVTEGLEVNAVAWACVTENATAAGGIPWLLQRRPRTRNGRVEEVMGPHPLLNLIRKANNHQGWSAFITELTAFYLASGNAFLLQIGPQPVGRGRPRELRNLVPDIQHIRPQHNQDHTDIVGYVFDAFGARKTTTYTTRQVYHIRGFHPRQEWYGLSPLAVAMRAIDISNEAQAWNVSLLQNKAVPPGALQSKEFLPPEQRDILRSEIDEKLAGSRNAGRPLLLHGGLEWLELGLTPSEMDWLRGKSDAALDICRAFNTPPELVGFSEGRTYSNYHEARKALYLENVLPWLDRLRDDLNGWLVPMFGDELFLDYNRDDIEALQEEQGALWARLTDSWWLTLNEKREAAGYDTLGTDGDVLLVPAGLMPLHATREEAVGQQDVSEEERAKMLLLAVRDQNGHAPGVMT